MEHNYLSLFSSKASEEFSVFICWNLLLIGNLVCNYHVAVDVNRLGFQGLPELSLSMVVHLLLEIGLCLIQCLGQLGSIYVRGGCFHLLISKLTTYRLLESLAY